jgi:ABC-2 type transport system ATP-binding protein
MSAITATALRKTYGDHTVLDGIDLDIPTGTIFALLGPNGAGKTTIVDILTTLTRPDTGHAHIAGHDITSEPDAVRAAIGVTGQFSAVDPLLTGTENLTLIADLHHLTRAETRSRTTELLDRFDLTDAAHRLARTYSGGMIRRLDLAMSLIGQPSVLFLDEPTTGLDPRSRRTLWHAVRDLAAAGVTVFLTTQYLDEADQLAHHIAVLDHGHIAAHGTPDELKRLVTGGHITIHFTDPAGLDAAARALGHPPRDPDTLTLRIPSDGSLTAVKTLIDRLAEDTITVDRLAIHTPDLDDVFFAITGDQKATTP